VLPSPVVSLTLQRESNILAVICDDLIVRLFDIETKRLVRELTGFKGRVLDMVSTLVDYFIWPISSMPLGLLP
jgi:U3 small nucleolar RNA-associated protein 21